MLGITYANGKLQSLYESADGSTKTVMWAEYLPDKTLFTHPALRAAFLQAPPTDFTSIAFSTATDKR